MVNCNEMAGLPGVDQLPQTTDAPDTLPPSMPALPSLLKEGRFPADGFPQVSRDALAVS